jgi:predicted TIM-barrel fold metal-dependent hydrolase
VAVDSSGSAYVVGHTNSTDFPVANAFQATIGPTPGFLPNDAFLTKFAPDGQSLVYSTFLGGSGFDEAKGVAIDSQGRAHVVGRTTSTDFPTANAARSALAGSADGFITKFDSSGNQLVFSTFAPGQSELVRDVDLSYATTRALTRGIVEFCAGDRRLLPVTFVPLTVPERAIEETRFALDAGVKGITIPPLPPATHSITHPSLHPLYALCEERRVPILFHVENDAPRKIAKGFSENGFVGQTDFHGGGENFTGLLYMAVSHWVEIALSALVFDQILEKFPRLMVGVIELGAVWVPAWLERMEIVKDTFGRTESRIRELPFRPSEYARRQIRVTPYPTEDVGRLVERCGAELFMFSSDYPHVEGGRNPIKRFEASLAGASEETKRRFYGANMVELMGPMLTGSV